MALTKHGIRANGLSFLRDQTVERERGEEKREEEEEEEEKKRRRGEAKIKQKGMETELKYGIVWIYGILRLSMVNSLSPKARVLI